MNTATPDYLLPNARRLPLSIHSGDGCYVFDGEGRRYLDLVAGIGVNALGHSHPRITAVIAEQSALCIHSSNLYSHPHQAKLAGVLCGLAGLDRALFTNSGTEATEAALKLARCYGRKRETGKIHAVALNGSFHGRTRGALALAGQAALREPFAPFATEVTFVNPNDETALGAAVSGRTAAVILEPILGEGGVRPLTANFLRAAREITRRHDALLIVDECQTGLGRTGDDFAFEAAGIRPDIVTVAKPLAAGLPMGAVLFSEAVNDSFPSGAHASTFGGGPLTCRVALEFLEILRDLLPHIRHVGRQMRAGLEEMRSRRPIIQEIRSRGLMLGIQLDRPGHGFVRRALDRGLLINCTQENVLRLLPPYIISCEQAQQGLEILDGVLADA
ncbi:MAG TPA: aminotransferase class III-fold pyridoxal phosphate-dependent enzyme [Bryobacteraceae bacterium]|nr:aminotransferase class III-fold pyridoxal phosphate-dependent enzyme [Bryobacteraceae bacterium]